MALNRFAVQWRDGQRTEVPGTERRILPGGHTAIVAEGIAPVILLRGAYKLCWPLSDKDK
jgi:hypothetical protein